MTAPSIISLQNVSKNYIIRNWKTILIKKPQQVQALKDASLSVYEGEILGLLGPNGAGKTTLLKLLATLIAPDSGKIFIQGKDAVQHTLAIRKKLGFINTNGRSFYWRLTGRENLSFYGHLFDLQGKALTTRINEVLELVGLSEMGNRRFGTYSSGEHQRLAIARAMLSKPDILLMDEATANLDPIVSRNLLLFTKETLSKKEGKTIIWCTHNLSEADFLCDRLAVINKGKIITCDKTESLKKHINKKQRIQFKVSAIPDNLKFPSEFTTVNNGKHPVFIVKIEETKIPQIIKQLVESNIDIFECKTLELPLEEAFSNLILKEEKQEAA